MSEILADYTWDKRRRGRPTKYPWDEWMDGQIRRIVWGKDFNCKVESMRAALRTRVPSDSPIKVRTSVADKERMTIVFQYYDNKEEEYNGTRN